MRLGRIIFLALVYLFFSTSCSSKRPSDNPSQFVLNKHKQFSKFTDPGDLASLYNNLPESINDLCDLIKKQLIHPFDAHKFGDAIPQDRKFEDREYPTVSDMLAELVSRNGNGLVTTRKPDERLVVACVHHSMLLTSILRHRGIPVRMRAGYANYIVPQKDIKVSHVICEVWDGEENRWMLVDPDRNIVNLPRNEFEFAFESWERLINNDIDRSVYFSRSKNVDQVILHLLCHDLYYVAGTEELYWNDPPVVFEVVDDYSDLSRNDLNLINELAGYLKNPDSNYNELVKLHEDNLILHLK